MKINWDLKKTCYVNIGLTIFLTCVVMDSDKKTIDYKNEQIKWLQLDGVTRANKTKEETVASVKTFDGRMAKMEKLVEEINNRPHLERRIRGKHER